MKDFTEECISLGLSVNISEIGGSVRQGETAFYHRRSDEHRSSVRNLKHNEVMKDVDKTVFLLGSTPSDCDAEKSNSSSKDAKVLETRTDTMMVQYGRLGRNKALSSVFVLDNVLLPLLRQEIAKRQKSNQESNLRSSLHLTYAKKFASHVCRFHARTKNGLKLSFPPTFKFEEDKSNNYVELELLEECVKDWIVSIQGAVDYELEQPHMEVMKVPLEEVEFWRRRHMIFSDISEQLKSKKVGLILDRLRASGSHVVKKLQERVNDLSKIEIEAAENVKFLATLERHFRILKDGSLDGIHSTIPALLDGMRMVWTISKFYCRDDRMAPLLVLVAKQIVSKVKDNINLQDIITQNYDQSHQMLLKAQQVLEQWKRSYMDTREKIEVMGKGQRQWEFDRSRLFETTDYMSDICSQLIKALEAMEDLHQFLKPEYKRIMGKMDKDSIAFEELGHLQNLFLNFNLDPFDRTNEKEWYILRNQFNTAIGEVEEHADAFLQKSFHRLQSSEAAFHLIQQFKALMSRPRIRQIISLRHQDMIQQYEEELELLEDHFIHFKDDPPLSFGHQKSPGSIIWANGLYLRAKRPILLFQKEDNLLENGLGFKVKNSYLRFARSIESYNESIFNTWEERARIASYRCLRMPLLKIISEEEAVTSSELSDNTEGSTLSLPPKLHLMFDYDVKNSSHIGVTHLQSSFSSELRRLIEETKHFDAMGYAVPEEALHLTLQEQTISSHAIDLNKLAKLINETLDSMTSLEFSVMKVHMKVLNTVLNPALKTINWSSQRISAFITTAFHAIEKFRSKLSEVRKHFSSAEKLALEIEKEAMVNVDCDYKVATLRDLLSSIEANVQLKLSNMKRHYQSIGQILINVEMAVCETDSGSSTFLEQYYCFWTKRIYNAIIEMTFRSIFCFCFSLLSGQLSSTFCKVDILVDDKVIVSEPSLSEIKKYNVRFIRMACNVSKQFSRWMHQTCLLSEENVEASSSRASAVQLEYSFYKDSSRNSIIGSTILGQHMAMIAFLREIYRSTKEYQTRFNSFNTKCLNWTKKLDQRIKAEVPTALVDNLMRECHSTLAFPPFTRGQMHVDNSYGLDTSMFDRHVRETMNDLKLDLDDILLTLGRDNLDSLKTVIQNYNRCLDEEPASIDELKVVINHIRDIYSSNMAIELKCKEVTEKFILMKQHDIAVTEEEFAKAISLYSNWQNLTITARAVDTQLNRKREEFKKYILVQNQEFKSKLIQMRERFLYQGPGCQDMSLDSGFLSFQEWQTNLNHLTYINEDLNDSEEILGMNVTVYPDLTFIAESMNEFSQIYKAYELLTEELQIQSTVAWGFVDVNSINEILKLVDSSLQHIQVEHSKTTWDRLHARLEDLKSTIPLLKKLHHQSMKERHWEKLANMCNMHLKSLTLCHILELNLHLKTSEVDAVLELAIQEQKLEKHLSEISDFWSKAQLNMKRYPGHSSQFILNSLDEIMLQLEDHLLLLQAMIGSKYSSQYLHEIKHWENCLNLITECLGSWTYLQQKWTYLESIFSGSNDIRAQLPKGAQLFDEVSKVFQIMMKRTYEVPNVLHSCSEERSLSIVRLSRKLDLCQKSLSEYLGVKRACFARFYFLSDEEMISILGNTGAAMVEPHLIKMFENVKCLDFAQGQSKVTGMRSCEGEIVRLINSFSCSGQVEEWMSDFEEEMRYSIHHNIRKSIFYHATESQRCWIEKSIGMCAISASQIWWTWQVEDTFNSIQNGDRQAMQKLEVILNSDLSDLVTMVRSKLDVNTTRKLNSLVIMKVHERDIISSFVQESVIRISDYEWESKIRYYVMSKIDKISIQQCVGSFHFANEYLGLAKRLIMTPLTDRCYLTLTLALTFGLGGAALGPAGTGKTETVKDLAKSFGLPCFVLNCGEGLDYIAMASTFAGLLQTGAWGCFDEFNRIKVEVLSVISAQLEIIRHSISKGYKTVDIGIGTDIQIKEMHGFTSLGIFVTMNPSYAGRTELPVNLKSLFRPIAMVSPDYCKIVENLLFSEGFLHSKYLAKKVVSLYNFAKDQLSQEKHYDFGLRSLKTVLAMSSRARVKHENLSEEELMVHILQLSNISKLTPQDEKLFSGFIHDLFPDVKILPKIMYETPLVEAVKSFLSKKNSLSTKHCNLQEKQIKKVLQLHETQSSRHSTMLIGPSCGGKSFILQTLASAHFEFDRKIVKLFHVNPKAQCVKELHGSLDILTRDWTDGIFSQLLRMLNQPLPPGRFNEERWIVLDGDIDPIWVENLNSVMDDNKVLTLPNSERIFLQSHCSIIFEVHDLQHASPATISRCGMVWVDPTDLPHRLYYEHWVKQRYVNVKENPIMIDLFTLYAEPVIELLTQGKTRGRKKVQGKNGLKFSEIIPNQSFELCRQLCSFLDAFLPLPEDEYNYNDTNTLSNIFIYCILFGVGGRLSSASKAKLNQFIVEICDLPVPQTNIHEHFFCVDTKKWLHLDNIVEKYKEPEIFDYHKIFVPTATSVSFERILKNLVPITPTLLFGERGSMKTSICANFLSLLSKQEYSKMKVNMSSVQTSTVIKQILDSKIEKKIGNYYSAPLSKNLAIFVDDLHVPEADAFGTKQPIEFMRTLLYQGFYHGCEDGVIQQKYVKGVHLVGTLLASSISTIDMHPRFLSNSCLLHVPNSSNQELNTIFGQIIEQRALKKCGQQGVSMQDLDKFAHISRLSIEILDVLKQKFPMSPSKYSCSFTMNNLHRVYKGLCSLDERYYCSPTKFVQVWRKEIYHNFFDQFSSEEDLELAEAIFEDVIEKKCTEDNAQIILEPSKFLLDLNQVTRIKNEPHHQFPADQFVYSYTAIQKIFSGLMYDYNREQQQKHHGSPPIVLFEFAINHLLRIMNALQYRRGNLLLVGFGGSGKKSLVRLASYAMECTFIEIERGMRKGYSVDDFKDDVKEALKRALSSSVVLLLSEELLRTKGGAFLEMVNDIVNDRNPLGLFESDELQVFCHEFQCADEESLLQVCMANLHFVFTVSPSGNFLRFLFQQFPSLVSSFVVDWFFAWPNEALKMVATNVLLTENEELLSGGETRSVVTDKISNHMVLVHNTVNKLASDFCCKTKRFYKITPKVFFDYLMTLNKTYKKCVHENLTSKQQYKEGLSKMLDVSQNILHMKNELKEQKTITERKTKDIEELISRIEKKREEVTVSSQDASKKQNKISKQNKQIETEKKEADVALFEALPAIEAAAEALNNIRREDLQELKAFNNPPIHVKIVCQMCTILSPTGEKLDETWVDARKMLGHSRLIDLLKEYPKDTMTVKMYQSCKQILRDNKRHDISVENLTKISKAGRGLLVWVFALLKYYEVKIVVDPLRERVKEMQKAQTATKKELAETSTFLESLDCDLSQLRMEYDIAKDELSALQYQSSEMEKRLHSAMALIDGLQAEQERWKVKHDSIERDLEMTFGNTLLFSSFQSYCGAFNDEFRKNFIKSVKNDLLTQGIVFDEGIEPHRVVVNDEELHEWNSEGLLMDSNLIQNCTLLVKGSRCPLCIDPHSQALKWIKKYYGSLSKNLCVKSMNETDYIKHLELAIEYGNPFVLELVDENIDPTVISILSQKVEEENGRRYVQLRDKRVEWNDQFILFLHTNVNNPHYTPEIMSTINLVNFSITTQGMVDSLLSIVLKEECPDLEFQYQDLLQKMGSNTLSLGQSEGVLLKELSLSSGNILDNEALMETLQKTRENAYSMKQIISECNKTKLGIEEARRVYHAVAQRGSTLYFASSQLIHLNKMYEFSIEIFVKQFIVGLKKAKKNDIFRVRIENLIKSTTREIFDYINIGIFNSDRLTYAFNLTCMILDEENNKCYHPKVDHFLFNFFLSGKSDFGVSQECPSAEIEQHHDSEIRIAQKLAEIGIPAYAWEMLTFLAEKNKNIASLKKEWIKDPSLFLQWFQSLSEETPTEFPPLVNKDHHEEDEMTGSISSFEKLCLMKIFLPHQCYNSVKHFVAEELGKEFLIPPPLDYKKAYLQSNSTTPILLLLSKGSDPCADIKKLGEHFGFVSPQKLHIVSLGQGQGPKALHAIKTAALMGHWALLQNCHLLIEWVTELEGHMNSLDAEPHKDFRLWLTTEPSHSSFPNGVLQSSHRVVVEQASGLRVHMQSNLVNIDKSVYERRNCCNPAVFGPILFCLAFVHSVMQERQKYGKLGWNDVPYNFTQGDFAISQQLLSSHLSKNHIELGNEDTKNISWDLLKYLIGDIIYGGRVSDEQDNRILQTYFDEYFGDFLFIQDGSFCLSMQNKEVYTLPEVTTNTQKSPFNNNYSKHIESYPLSTKPNILGLNANAEVKYFVDKIEEICSKSMTMSRMKRTADGTNDNEDETKRFNEIKSVSTQILRILTPGSDDCGQVFLTTSDEDKNKCLFDITNKVEDHHDQEYYDNKEEGENHNLMNAIFFRELRHWNKLCSEMFKSLNSLLQVLNGEEGMNDNLNEIATSFYDGNVPVTWTDLSPPRTTKKLTSWIKHFQKRYEQYKKWFEEGQPKIIWLGGLHLPKCFLSALLQKSCRANGWALDDVMLFTEFTKFSVIDPPEANVTTTSSLSSSYNMLVAGEEYIIGEGNNANSSSSVKTTGTRPPPCCYISGLYLDGATWDIENSHLMDHNTKSETYTALPLMKIVPILKDKFDTNKYFRAPVYANSLRNNGDGKGQILNAYLNTNKHHSFWILQGVAVLLNAD